MDKVVQCFVLAAICALVRSQKLESNEAGKDLDVTQGENFTRNCKVTNAGRFDEIHWLKDNVLVNKFAIIKSPFLETKRYSAALNEDPTNRDILVTHLTVTGAMPEDEGTYTCVHTRQGITLGSKSSEVFLSEVPSSVTLYIDDGSKSNRDENGTLLPVQQTTTLKEGKTVNVTCVSEGGNPAPTVTMKLVQGQTSHDLPFKTSAVQKEFGTVAGLKYNRTLSITLYDDKYAPNYIYNGYSLACEAYVMGKSTIKSDTQLTITESAAPKLDNCNEKLTAYVGSKMNNKFFCDVTSKGTFNFSWDLPSNFTISKVVDNYEKRYRTYMGPDINGARRVTLEYLDVQIDDSGDVRLVVNNTHGKIEETFLMVTKGAVSGSRTLTGSLVVFFVTMLMAGFITL